MKIKIKLTCSSLILLLMMPMLATAEIKLSPPELAEKIQNFEKLPVIWRPSEALLSKLKRSLSIKDAIHREWSLHQHLKTISVDYVDKESRQWLQQLSDYQSETKSWLNDGDYQIEITVWKIADQAKGILARWEIVQAKKLALKKLSEANWQELLTENNKNYQQGYLQAINSSPEGTLFALGSKLSKKTFYTDFETKLLWKISQETQNLNWMKRVITTANAKFSTQLMKQNLNANKLSSEAFIGLLKEAVTNPHLASFALLELGNHLHNNQSVSSLLLKYLDDKNLGGSAARALSKSHSLQIEQQLKVLSQSEQPLLKARAKQALNWQQQSLKEKQ